MSSRDPSTWAMIWCFPQCILTGSWIRSGAGTLIRDIGVSHGDLIVVWNADSTTHLYSVSDHCINLRWAPCTRPLLSWKAEWVWQVCLSGIQAAETIIITISFLPYCLSLLPLEVPLTAPPGCWFWVVLFNLASLSQSFHLRTMEFIVLCTCSSLKILLAVFPLFSMLAPVQPGMD